MIPPVGSLVLVRWLDSGLARSAGWESASTMVAAMGPEQMEAETVGYLIHSDEDCVILAQTRDIGNDMFLSAQGIARQAITNVAVLAETS